jgi:hypothetical protein
MAQAPRPPGAPTAPPPAPYDDNGNGNGRQARKGEGHRPAPGEPGSQRISPPPPDLSKIGPPPPRPGVIPNQFHQQSVFENQPGQQIVGRPAHEGYEIDRQHLRGRTIADGNAEEDQEPIPEGVPTAEVTLVPEHPNVEDEGDEPPPVRGSGTGARGSAQGATTGVPVTRTGQPVNPPRT